MIFSILHQIALVTLKNVFCKTTDSYVIMSWDSVFIILIKVCDKSAEAAED